jgi:hypothetical protein
VGLIGWCYKKLVVVVPVCGSDRVTEQEWGFVWQQAFLRCDLLVLSDVKVQARQREAGLLLFGRCGVMMHLDGMYDMWPWCCGATCR